MAHHNPNPPARVGGWIFPHQDSAPPPPTNSLSRSRGGWGGTKTDARSATSVFPSADIASPIPPLLLWPSAAAVVMAQNRFSIFCRRKTTEEEEEEGRRKGIVPKTALATSATAERRNRQVVMLPSEGKGRPFFWRHLGVMMGNIPYYGKQIAWRALALAVSWEGLSVESVIATKALEMSHFRRAAETVSNLVG